MSQSPSKIGLIGLGKMGSGLALNMMRNGYEVFAYDTNPDSPGIDNKIAITTSVIELVGELDERKVVWVMVPHGDPIRSVVDTLAVVLNPGDIIIDGGNSHFKESQNRSERLKESGIHFLDCGTSGGPSGALNGICSMIGGNREAYEYCRPLFDAISVDNGSLYCGPSGSGHFVKMVHNGIEYGMMQSIAEGFELLDKSEFDLDLSSVANLWNHGSVVRSWLIELKESALEKHGDLSALSDRVNASGEGKWTVEAGLEMGVPTPVIALALMMRSRSMQDGSFAGRLLAALRNEFGGHDLKSSE